MEEEKKYWVGFSVFPGVGPVRFSLLRKFFGSARAAWEAPVGELIHIHLGDKLAHDFSHFRQKFDLDKYIADLGKLHISVLTLDDSRYPPQLQKISDPPFVLYVRGKRGEQPLDLSRCIGVVGTRKMTHYGAEITEKITAGLVAAGCVIVSGMAYGVDAIAHRTAIDLGAKTIAVLGCGVDVIAPVSSKNIYDDIVGGAGAVISEMPLGLRPGKGLFPARNRIISGLSLGVVVTEGAFDSGALITARNAAEQGREVFAVPGPVTSEYSRGPAKLIKAGATLVESAQDVLEALGLDKKNWTNLTKLSNLSNLTDSERKIVAVITGERSHLDELVRRTGLTTADVSATLTILELKGILKDYGEKEYGLCN